MDLIKTALGRLRFIGFLEGASFIFLLGVAMPLKYFADQPEAVRVVGMAHGILFLLYCALGLQAGLEYRWSWQRTLLVLLASIVPLGPFYLDARVLKTLKA